MPADVEAKAVMLDGPADAADMPGVFLDDDDFIACFGQQIRGGEAGWSRPDDGNVDGQVGTWRACISPGCELIQVVSAANGLRNG